MYIKIYFNDKPLFLCDSVDELIEPLLHHDDTVYIDELDAHTVKSMIHEMEVDKVHAGVFLHHDLKALKKAFFKKFTLVPAAGGIVINDDNNILLMYRKGKWDLPKGKQDKGEDLETCAIREVQEETGLEHVELREHLGTSHHTYHEGTRFLLKETHWYLMHASNGQKLVPQSEEDISELKWIPVEELETYMKNSYASIADVLKMYMAY